MRLVRPAGILVLAVVSAAPAPVHAGSPDPCAGVAPVSTASLVGVPVVTGLTGRPLFVTAPPGDVDRIFVVEQNGTIRVKHRGTPPGTYGLFLDISAKVATGGNEQGLLGLAFDPGYPANGRFYVDYTQAGTGATIVARYSVSAGDPDAADPLSETVLLTFPQPESNHNGGYLEFGADGYLYIGTGDGGGSNDLHGTCGNGQDTGTLLGKILRIDPSSAAPVAGDCGGSAYTIPSDNPLVDGAGGNCDEIWAWGLRNPWRFSFDPQTGDLYVGDVGQNCWEEIDWVAGGQAGGQNFGWRAMEGSHCFNTADAFNCSNPAPQVCLGSPACNDPTLTDPVLDYISNSVACSVTGGYVYRGCLMPSFHGAYFYGDYCDGQVRSFRIVGGAVTDPTNWTSRFDPGGTLQFGLTSFGRDARGELYVTDRSPGAVLKFLPPFSDLEVSANGAGVTFRPSRVGDWTWEDVEYETMHPVSFYRVYRGAPGGTFDCIHATTTATWPAGGDPTVPASGQLAAYLVTAVAPDGSQTKSGTPPRTLANPCPAP